jgi:hypothetical protein
MAEDIMARLPHLLSSHADSDLGRIAVTTCGGIFAARLLERNFALQVENGVRTYEAVEGWGELKPGWIWGQVGDVAVDSNDRVHVFTRNANPPYRIYDITGKLLHSWGHGLFEDAHGICIGPDDMVYLTDRGPQLVMKFTIDGRHLFTIGERYQHSDTGYADESPTVKQAGPPFHHPTNVGLRPNGEFFVSDGYRNARVHNSRPTAHCCPPGENPARAPVNSTWSIT